MIDYETFEAAKKALENIEDVPFPGYLAAFLNYLQYKADPSEYFHDDTGKRIENCTRLIKNILHIYGVQFVGIPEIDSQGRVVSRQWKLSNTTPHPNQEPNAWRPGV